MSFHEIRFPTDVSFGSEGGPERRTEIVTLGSGHEERNTRWADSRRRYNAGYGVKSLADLHEVIEFFEERRGKLYGFRWKDHADYKSCSPSQSVSDTDQVIGGGDDVTDTFQLIKTYGGGYAPYVRSIKKTVSGTVQVAVDGVSQQVGTAYTIDNNSGTISFQPGHIPANSGVITAGYEFDVPVRLDTDQLSIDLTKFNAGAIPSIPIVEIRI